MTDHHVHIRLRPLYRDARLQVLAGFQVHRKVARLAVDDVRVSRVRRYPNIAADHDVTRRRDFDQGSRRAVQRHHRAQNFRIAVEPLRPQLVRHRENGWRPRFGVRRAQRPSQFRLHPQGARDVVGHPAAAEEIGLAIPGIKHVHTAEAEHILEHVGLFPKVRELRHAQPQASPSFRARRVVNEKSDEPVGVAVREGRDENGVDHAEHHRRRADSQRQRDNRHRREPPVLPQRSHAVAQVLPDPLDCLHTQPLICSGLRGPRACSAVLYWTPQPRKGFASCAKP